VAARLRDDIPDFDGIVIGGDSMFELDGEVLGKPYTAENAVARWRAMRGRTGVLHSGHAVVRIEPGAPPHEVHATAAASVSFVEDVTDAEIEAYVANGGRDVGVDAAPAGPRGRGRLGVPVERHRSVAPAVGDRGPHALTTVV
jgi:predicted house-cleaning NTP pyrophosphatase (Maf/HAM1 superfamily)